MRQQRLEEENKKLQDCIQQLIKAFHEIYPQEIPPDENENRDDLSKLDGE